MTYSSETTSTKSTKYYRVKMPIHHDLKNWLKKWWGRDEFKADNQTVFGAALKMALEYGDPPFEPENKTIEEMEDFIFVLIPHGSYLTQRKIRELNTLTRLNLVDQIAVVSLCKRHSLESPSVAVIQYYLSEFNLRDYTDVALDKASLRLREQRGIAKFRIRKR